MSLPLLFQNLAIAAGLGLLVGLQRERTASRLAGVRTFPLIAILGAIAGLLGQTFGGWIVGAGFLALTGVVVAANAFDAKREEVHPGITSEIAIFVMYAVGAYLMVGSREIAIVTGAGVAVLLQFKERMHGIASRLSDTDVRALMQFVLVAFVILPALPDYTVGPYDVLNPHRIWLMVVLIVGISLGGYVAYKLYGKNAGTVLAGVLGGLISSTATTVSYARRVARKPDASGLGGLIILIASGIVFARLIFELSVAATAHARTMAPPLALMFATFVVLSTVAWFWVRHRGQGLPESENPSELKSALVFGLLYAVVLFAVAAAKAHFGDRGLYVVAALSGLTDVDAITLSTAQLVTDNRLDPDTGWRIVLLAATSNLVFKAATVAVLGNRRLFTLVAVTFGVAVLVAAGLLVFW